MNATQTFSFSFFDRIVDFVKYKSLKHPHFTKSLILHLFILLAISGMLPRCSKDIEPPKIISIDILPIGEEQKTTPKVTEQKIEKQEVKKEEPKPLPPKEIKKPVEATKMEKAEIPKPVAKPEEKKPAPKKVEKKPEIKKEVKKEELQKKDEKDQEGKKKLLKDLAEKDQAALDNIFDKATNEPKPASQKTQSSGKSEVVDPAFINELMGKIQSQISQCWNIPIGAKNVENMRVRLFIALNPNGTVTNVQIMDQVLYTTNNEYRVVADTALWAVKECSPLQGLPADKYDLWKEVEFSFDPSQAL